MPSVEGVGARRAALQMLDSVLRRGQTLDAAGAHVRGLSAADHGLAVAIAGEALRRLPDLDALIAGALAQHFGLEPARVMATLFPESRGGAIVKPLILA